MFDRPGGGHRQRVPELRPVPRRQHRRGGTGQEIVRNACPGPGACGGMYTANTMATAIEAMGMSLPYSSSTPATDPAKLDECRQAGAVVRALMEKDIKPRDIMTRTAFENAMVMVMVLGGSTNAVLHLIAMARAVDVDLTIDDFQSVSRPDPLHRRPEAQRQVRDGGTAPGRRGAGGDEVPPRRGPHRRRLPDLHRARRSRRTSPNAAPASPKGQKHRLCRSTSRIKESGPPPRDAGQLLPRAAPWRRSRARRG